MTIENSTLIVERGSGGKLMRSYSHVTFDDTVGSALEKLATLSLHQTKLKRPVLIAGPAGSGRNRVLDELGYKGCIVQNGKVLYHLARVVSSEREDKYKHVVLSDLGKDHAHALKLDLPAREAEVQLLEGWATRFDFFSHLPLGVRTGNLGEVSAYYVYCPYEAYKTHLINRNIRKGVDRKHLLLTKERYFALACKSMESYWLVMNYGREYTDLIHAAEVILVMEKDHRNLKCDIRDLGTKPRKILEVQVDGAAVNF